MLATSRYQDYGIADILLDRAKLRSPGVSERWMINSSNGLKPAREPKEYLSVNRPIERTKPRACLRNILNRELIGQTSTMSGNELCCDRPPHIVAIAP